AVADYRISLVHLVQVEVAGAQPVRAGHGALFHHRRHRQHRQDLGGQEDTLVVLPQRLAQDFFAAPEPVDLSSVEQGDTQLQRPAHDGPRDLVGVPFPVSPLPGPELPGSQTNLGDLLRGADVQITHDPSVHPAPRYRTPTTGSGTFALPRLAPCAVATWPPRLPTCRELYVALPDDRAQSRI